MYKFITPILLLALSVPATGQNGLWLDGSNDYCHAMNGGPTGNAARTVEAWVNINVISSSQQVLVTWGEMTIGERFTLNVINGIPRIEVGGSGFSSSTALAPNSWHHVAATYDPNASPYLKLYVDGVLKSSGNPTVTVNTSIYGGLTIGRRQDSINYFNGRMDEVRIWNYTRTAADIATFRTTEFCAMPTGLTSYYRFNQGTANGNNAGITTLNDDAGNNSAVMYGFALSGTTSNWVAGAPVIGNGMSSQTVNTCGPYTTPGGITYTMNGTYVDTTTTSTGCASILTTVLTITPLDTAVGQAGNTLQAQGSGLSYQWLNCNSGFSVINGSTNSVFTPGVNGSYAVQVSGQGCVDTSGCHSITTVGIWERESADPITVHPNPATDQLTLSAGTVWAQARYRLSDIQGRSVRQGQLPASGQTILDIADLQVGTYVLEVRSGDRSQRAPVLKQ